MIEFCGVAAFIVLVAGVGWIIHMMNTAPLGIEIPGVGFVEIKEAKDE